MAFPPVYQGENHMNHVVSPDYNTQLCSTGSMLVQLHISSLIIFFPYAVTMEKLLALQDRTGL